MKSNARYVNKKMEFLMYNILSIAQYSSRLLVRLLLIKVCEREEELDANTATLWAKRFAKIMEMLPKTVGEIVRVGQWLHTPYGREFLRECTQLAIAEFGDSPNVHRLCQSWGTAIFAARKVNTSVRNSRELCSLFCNMTLNTINAR